MAIASHIRHSMSTDFLELSPLILARPSATKFYHAAGNDKCSKTLHELNNLVLSPCYWLCQMLHYLMNEIFYKISFILRPYKIIYFFYLLNHSIIWLLPLTQFISCNQGAPAMPQSGISPWPRPEGLASRHFSHANHSICIYWRGRWYQACSIAWMCKEPVWPNMAWNQCSIGWFMESVKANFHCISQLSPGTA